MLSAYCLYRAVNYGISAMRYLPFLWYSELHCNLSPGSANQHLAFIGVSDAPMPSGQAARPFLSVAVMPNQCGQPMLAARRV